MKRLNYPIIFLTCNFIVGVIIGFSIAIEIILFYGIYAFVFSVFILAFFRAKKKLFPDAVFPVFCALLFLLSGYWVTQLHQPKHKPSHYLNHIANDEQYIKLTLTQELKPNRYFDNYIAEVTQIDQQYTEGKLLLSIPNKTVKNYFQVDDELLVHSRFEMINSPLNPEQFDYQNYLKNKQIYRQILASPDEIVIRCNSPKSLTGMATELRKSISKELFENGFSKTQISIINALLLGQKSTLSEDIYTTFSQAGIVHILAVSGLHIGIILGILFWIFQPLRRLKKGVLVQSFLAVLILWMYAVLVGLSPSVLRAVTMFSFVSIGIIQQRKTSVLNMLFVSAFVLLFYNPNSIFEVGFQLSYAAVFAIVTLQPKISKLYKPKTSVISYLWSLTTVSLSAQLGVLPISLFYFHQFPGLFIISNLLIIPCLAFIIGTGFVCILLAIAGYLPDFLVTGYGKIIDSLLWLVQQVAKQESFRFSTIYFSTEMLISSIILIGLFLFFLYRKAFRYLLLFCSGIIAFQLVYIAQHYWLGQQKEAYILHKSKASVLLFVEGKQGKIHSSIPAKMLKNSSLVTNFTINKGIKQFSISDTIESLYKIEDNYLLVIDSLANYQLPNGITPRFILLRNSPKVNLSRLIDQLQPYQIIADGSNYKTYVKRWQKTCTTKKTPFYHTGEKGAFSILKN